MYRNNLLSPPNALDIARLHLAHGTNAKETTVSQDETTSEMAKEKFKTTGQSELDFGLDLKGVKLDFDSKSRPKSGNKGRKYNVSAPFQHKRALCNVYLMNMTNQSPSGWYVSHDWHKYQFKPIADQLESMNKEVPHYMKSWSEPGLRKDDKTDTYRRNKEGYKVCTNSVVLRVAEKGFSVDTHIRQMWNLMKNINTDKPTQSETPAKRLFDYLMEHKPNLVKYECGRSEKSKKKSITDDEFIKQVERSLKAVFSDYHVSYHVPLDRWMTTYQIKSFLEDECGYDSWDDIPRDLRTKVFFRTSGVPPKEWDDVEDEPLRL